MSVQSKIRIVDSERGYTVEQIGSCKCGFIGEHPDDFQDGHCPRCGDANIVGPVSRGDVDDYFGEEA